MKSRKAVEKRFKITKSGKILKRHQLAAGHLKRKKSKGALKKHKKITQLFTGDARRIRKVLGI